MQRIDGPTAAPALPAPHAVSGTPGYFTSGDPAVPTPATQVTMDWLNLIQEEMVHLATAPGWDLDKSNNTQMRDAVYAIVNNAISLIYASDAEAVAAAITTKAVTPHSAAALVSARINALVNGAPAALDTLKELADAINDDQNFAATVTTALAARMLTSWSIGGAGLVTGGGDGTAPRTLTVAKASSSDIASGSSDTKAITPAGLAGVGGSNSHGHWTILPGGFIEQWGGGTHADGTGVVSITFPQPFTDLSSISAEVTNNSGGGVPVALHGVGNFTTTGMTVGSAGVSGGPAGAGTAFYYRVIGR